MKIGIFGAGKIGTALALMLEQLDIEVTLADSRPISGAKLVDASNENSVFDFVEMQDAIVSALPFRLNKTIAKACAEMGKSYFDFTEDTDTTAFIQRLAESSLATFAPQCGLAPGAINIAAAALIDEFDGPIRTADLRVGALPYSTTNQMGYYLSWSSAGLVNEYIKPCDALYGGQPIKTLPLDGLERVIIDGVAYEAFNTSGGVATMCETYKGRVGELTYKTMRYPGHRDHMRFVLKDLGLEFDPKLLETIMDKNVAVTESDVVILYASVVGESGGNLRQKTYTKKIYPMVVGYQQLSAIQTSTAAGMAAVIELWMGGKFAPGFVRQETIRLEEFLRTKWGRAVYG